MKIGFLSLALGAVMLLATATPFAGTPQTASADPIQVQGARGLVNVLVGLQAGDVDIVDDVIVTVQGSKILVIDSSFNNLTALNNVLNNSPILSNNNVVVTDVVDIGNITVPVDVRNVLNNNDIVVGVAILNNVLTGVPLYVIFI